MMKDEQLRWGDVVLHSQKERLIGATLQAIKDAPMRLLELEIQSIKIREVNESMPFPGPKKIVSYWLTRDGLAQKIVTGRRQEYEQSQLVSTDDDLSRLITQRQISTPDIQSAFKRAEDNHTVVLALRALVSMPQVNEMMSEIRLSNTLDVFKDRSLYLTPQGLRQGHKTRILKEEITPELVMASSADIERIKKAKKMLEA